jgi:hypothetical protein
LKLRVRIGLDEIRADEFYAMLTLADEWDRLDQKLKAFVP